MTKLNETRSLPGIPAGPELIWSALPLCRCGGTGTMPVIGWPGRTVICACEAGKMVAANTRSSTRDI